MALQKTALHNLHIERGAKMGEFAGYDMPLYYGDGVIKEHEWVRSSCGLFDVSHMGQAMLKGPQNTRDTLDFVQKLTPSSFEKLAVGRTKYTVLTNETGGIIDDLMITHAAPGWYHFVLNAGCKDKDIAWIKRHLPAGCEFIYHSDWSLLALQGPEAQAVIKDVLEFDLSDMDYMDMRALSDNTLFISRLGYTGEDGFEIAVHNDAAEDLARKLLDHDAVKPIGLAARDSLRLEMGYALYGHEINDQTSPIEAGLGWVTSKNNDTCFGADRIQNDREQGTKNKLVGVRLTDKGVARDGAEIRNEADRKIGWLTSGGFSPTLKASIGMGYIQSDLAKTGEKIFVNVRGKNIAAEVAGLPFVPAKTKPAKKKAA